jgi:hypothetical protein
MHQRSNIRPPGVRRLCSDGVWVTLIATYDYLQELTCYYPQKLPC